MHIVTFYSFKGGVGRTLGLVNVAVQLAQTGRRVLLVDFDLEAPGLSTFRDLQSKDGCQGGVVDWITEYMNTAVSPDVREHVYSTTLENPNGSSFDVSIMPSGRPGDAYPQRLHDIHWPSLYSDHDGFLLFEDLKAQWRTELQPDYVLIDSRTGHTDVAGICTRQLPDSVVVMFSPNDQNLLGLDKIVSDIRVEAKGVRKKNIPIQFVMSNVPDIDDEELIIKRHLDTFKERLNFDSLSATIHQYPDLKLMDQQIFTLDRPETKLAEQYRELERVVIRNNVEDRQGAIEYLKTALSRSGSSKLEELPRYLDRIQYLHASDSEVSSLVSRGYDLIGRSDEAANVLLLPDETITDSAVLVQRAEIYRRNGNTEMVAAALKAVLNAPRNDMEALLKTAGMIRDLKDTSLFEFLPTSPAVQSLSSEERWLMITMNELDEYEVSAEAAEHMLKELLSADGLDQESVRASLSLILIATGRFQKAMTMIATNEDDVVSLDLLGSFNFGMAYWGEFGVPRTDIFSRVVLLGEEQDRSNDSNYEQCLSLTNWIAGNEHAAYSRLANAQRLAKKKGLTVFSAWTYRRVTLDEFLLHLEEMKRMFEGQSITPRFMKGKQQQSLLY